MVGDKKTSEERMDDRHLQGFGDWFDSEIYLFTKFHIWITRTVIFHQWKFEEAGLEKKMSSFRDVEFETKVKYLNRNAW